METMRSLLCKSLWTAVALTSSMAVRVESNHRLQETETTENRLRIAILNTADTTRLYVTEIEPVVAMVESLECRNINFAEGVDFAVLSYNSGRYNKLAARIPAENLLEVECVLVSTGDDQLQLAPMNVEFRTHLISENDSAEGPQTNILYLGETDRSEVTLVAEETRCHVVPVVNDSTHGNLTALLHELSDTLSSNSCPTHMSACLSYDSFESKSEGTNHAGVSCHLDLVSTTSSTSTDGQQQQHQHSHFVRVAVSNIITN